MENYKNKKSMKFQGDMLNFCDFIQVFVFTRNHHLKVDKAYRIVIVSLVTIFTVVYERFMKCQKEYAYY